MRTYFKNILALIKPYRVRFIIGLACGLLSGALAFTLPVSLTLAVETVFPGEQSASLKSTNNTASVTGTNVALAAGTQTAGQTNTPAAPARSTFSLPAPVKKVLDAAKSWFRPPERPSPLRIALAIALIPGAMLLRGVLTYLNMYLLSWVGIRATNDLRVRFFDHVINMPMSFFSHTSTGDLMARIEATAAMNNTINGSFGIMIREPVAILTLVVILIGWQPLLSLGTLVVFPICLVPVIIYGRKLRKGQSGIHAKFSHASKVMHEAYTATRVIKAYNLESLVVQQFRQATDAMRGFFMRMVRASELPGPLIEFIGAIGVALVFVYYAFISPERTAGVSNLLGFFMAVFGLYAPVKNLSRLHSQLTMARTAVEPIYQILAMKTNLPEPANPKPLKAHDATIKFDNVTFSYGEKTVLRNIHLTIQPGQFVALVGRTGSGKTSLANLLLRFYDPQAGAVLIGDTDIRQVSSRELRANIAVVTQETVLFNDTIRHNIALGRPGATDAEIEEAAKHSYAHDFIMEKKLGYEQVVGEKGATLSGGQKQRLAIARAVLKNAPILILDEATSSLDSEAEQKVQTALEELAKGRTTICIAHRLSTIQRADVIVVLDHGRIVEQGDHATLLQRGGVYHKLYSLQYEAAKAG